VVGLFCDRVGLLLSAARGHLFRPPQAGAYPCARILRALYLAYPAKQALYLLHRLVGANSFSLIIDGFSYSVIPIVSLLHAAKQNSVG
jgi:hypothetical protein